MVTTAMVCSLSCGAHPRACVLGSQPCWAGWSGRTGGDSGRVFSSLRPTGAGCPDACARPDRPGVRCSPGWTEGRRPRVVDASPRGCGAVAVDKRANFTPRSDAASVVQAPGMPVIQRAGPAVARPRIIHIPARCRAAHRLPPAPSAAAPLGGSLGEVISTLRTHLALMAAALLLAGLGGPLLTPAAEAHAVRAAVDPDPVGVWPLRPEPDVVADFDPPTTPYAAGHRGVDLAGSIGQPVLSALAGTVTFAAPLAGRGVVVVDHGATRTTYQPVRASAEVGRVVAAGDRIGRLEAAGSHCPPRACLHWGWLAGETYLDPLRLVGAGPIRLLPLWGDLPAAPGAPNPAPATTAPLLSSLWRPLLQLLHPFGPG